VPDKRPQDIHIDVHQPFVPEIRVEFLEVRFVVDKTALIYAVFKILDNRILPIVLNRHSGSGSLVGFSLQAYQILFSVR
jgi:hypothetical protein